MNNPTSTPIYNSSIVPFNAQTAVEMVKQLRLAVDTLRGSGELIPGLDFGKIPGTGDKDTLLLPGMEKLCRALNAVPEYIERAVIRDYDKPLFHYEYECRLIDADTGTSIPGGRGLGLCTSRESGFAWRWVQEHELPSDLDKATLVKRGGKTTEFAFAIDKAETSGKYGKPADYWQAFKTAIANGTAVEGTRETSRGASKTYEIDSTVYRIPNPDIFDQINTIMKRAKKRALGDAIKGAANVSAYFTVDLEDFQPYDATNVITVTATPVDVKRDRSDNGQVSDNQPSAKVSGAGLPKPAPQPENPAPAVVSAEPDPLNWTEDDPRLYHCDVLKVFLNKNSSQYVLCIKGSQSRIPVALSYIEKFSIGQSKISELKAGDYPLMPMWSVYADKLPNGDWEVTEIKVGMGEMEAM